MRSGIHQIETMHQFSIKKLHIMDMFKAINHNGHNLFTSTPDSSFTSDTKSVLFHQINYLAETTTQIYKGPPQPIQGYIAVVTRIYTKIRVGHPFDV